MCTSFFYLFAGLLVAWLLTPQVIKLAIKVKAYDHPSEIKIQEQPVPVLGGLVIFSAVLITLVYYLMFCNSSHVSGLQLTIILLAMIPIVITGVLDDLGKITLTYKFLGQFMAAFILIWGGLQFNFFNNFYFNVPFTLFYVVGGLNAFNWIDGLDGLAAGVAAIAALFFAVFFAWQANMLGLFMSILVLGACLGFLPYNFHPAKIFMGDTGSLFLGFMLVVLMFQITTPGIYRSVFMPIMILGLPILDAFFTIIRRVKNKRLAVQGDRQHFYDVLMKKYGHRNAVLLSYLFCLVFGILGLTVYSSSVNTAIIICCLVFLVACFFAYKLRLLSYD